MSQQVPLPRLAEQHSLYIIGKDKRNHKAKGNYGRYYRGVHMFKIHCIKFLNNILFFSVRFQHHKIDPPWSSKLHPRDEGIVHNMKIYKCNLEINKLKEKMIMNISLDDE